MRVIIFALFLSTILAGCLEDDRSDDKQQQQSSVTSRAYKQATSTIPFTPSLGINTEAVQPESGESGDSLMFADLFRTARPFKESSHGVTFDDNGWPISIAEGGAASTKLMETVVEGSIIHGDYTLLFDGSGDVGFGGGVIVSPLAEELSNQGYQGRTVTINAETVNGIYMVVTGISEGEGNYVKNIRLIMPGGVCGDVTHVWVEDASSCIDDSQVFESFVDKLKDDRNAIVFNPDYLHFMKDFNTVRMMNLMAASPGISTCRDGDNPGELIESCITHEVTWDDRAQLNDAAWGGSALTSLSTEHYVTNPVSRNGAPVEVMVELANQLGVNSWITMPHAANDDYISQFAGYVYQHLDRNLQVYLEYSNEVWNSGFAGFHYAQIKGIELGFNTLPNGFPYSQYRDENYFARLSYYSKRSVEVFELWKEAFRGTSRLVRTMGSFQGDTILSSYILDFEGASKNRKVDALAIAPYFYGCIVANYDCADAPMLLPNVQTVDDVFDVIDWEPSPNGLYGILRQIEKHADIAQQHRINLVAYEGGQSLVASALPSLDDSDEDEIEKARLRTLFADANKDPRMKQRYLTLLNGWRDLADKGTALFVLYTQPQKYYRYGSWGLKEHLNQPRSEAPKYDAALTFQETIAKPWWDYDRHTKAAIGIIINYMMLE